MNHLNSVLIEGDLARDPVKRVTKEGKDVCNFTIASSRQYKGENGALEKETCFFDVTAWGKLVENCVRLGRKGLGARVVGRLHQERWTDDNGRQHSKVIIVAEHIELR
jgi:single-strand DNA-binding protein